MEADDRVHLANPAAIQQYKGLKYTDDHSDARWLAHLLRLGVLPEGYIGYRFKPGHPVFSITCRDSLTALSWHGQLPDLCQHALKQIRKRPPEKPRRRCCPVCGSPIQVMKQPRHL